MNRSTTLKNTRTTLEEAPFNVGDWVVDAQTGRIDRNGETSTLEPKVMALLVLLANNAGKTLSRSDIEQLLWAGVVVGEDTVARSISKLRRALGDSAQNSVYIETRPKRGYRLLVPVQAVVPLDQQTNAKQSLQVILRVAGIFTILIAALITYNKEAKEDYSRAAMLTARADDLYMKFTRTDNEASIALYEKVLADNAEYAQAQAGLANALVQKVIRWPAGATSPHEAASSVQESLKEGLHKTRAASEILGRATAMAERASRLAPRNSDVLKALGLAYAAQGKIDEAERVYLDAIKIDSNAWESMINLGEIYQIRQEPERGLAMFIQAFKAMDTNYSTEPQRIGPWQAAVGVLIGTLYEEQNQRQEAELWYRRVLDKSPLEPEATSRLANVLRLSGDEQQANSLCEVLFQKSDGIFSCKNL